MGTSLGNLHVYKGNPDEVKKLLHQGEYMVDEISKEWTSVFCREFRDGATEKVAKKLSKTLVEPILSFQYFDDDFIYLVLFKQGKIIAQYWMGDSGEPYFKNCRSFISELGFDASWEKRLRNIFKCNDLGRKVDMLEEFLGVALYLDIDFLLDGTSSFEHHRDDVLYREYDEQLQKLKRIKNKTKAVMVQEFNGKMARFYARPFLLAEQSDDGVYNHDKCIMYDIKDDKLQPMFEKIRIHGHAETIFGRDVLLVYDKYNSEGLRCWRVGEDGTILGTTPLPTSSIKITAVLDEGDLICCTGYYHGDNEPKVLRLDSEGNVIWSVPVNGYGFWITPVVHNGFIFLHTRCDETEDDGALFKLDLCGKIVARKPLPGIKNHSEFIFIDGLIYYLGDYYGQKSIQEVFIKMDESLECIESITLPKEISIYSKAVLDRKAKVAYYNALDNIIVAIDMKSMEYRAEKLDSQISLHAADGNGFIYGSTIGSTVYVLDTEMKIQSKHRLKGDVYDVCQTSKGMFAVTGSRWSGWGAPENCLVRVYRIEHI